MISIKGLDLKRCKGCNDKTMSLELDNFAGYCIKCDTRRLDYELL